MSWNTGCNTDTRDWLTKIIIAILATLIVTCAPALAASNSNAAAPTPVTINARCQQLQITCNQNQLFEIGRKLGQLYFNRYHKKPPQKRGVNLYTTADVDLVDQAIVSQLATENQKLRQDLELQDTEIGLRTGQQK